MHDDGTKDAEDAALDRETAAELDRLRDCARTCVRALFVATDGSTGAAAEVLGVVISSIAAGIDSQRARFEFIRAVLDGVEGLHVSTMPITDAPIGTKH